MASIPTFSSHTLLLKPNTNTNTLFPRSFSNNNQSCTLSLTSLFGTQFVPFLQRPISSTRSISITNFRATSEMVPFNLPTDPNPQSDETKIAPNSSKWSARAIKAYAMGELEAKKLKYPKFGTEALLMGILIEGTSKAAKFLRANGITYFKVREQTLEILGKSVYYYSSLVVPSLTEPLQKALDWAVNETLKSGEEETNVTHLLLGIWSQEESAGRKVLSALGFNDEKVKEIAETAASGDIDWNFKKASVRIFLGESDTSSSREN